MNIICLDTETNGVDQYSDEILQLSIIDGCGAILFNEYIKPVHHDCWDRAEMVNHISPLMVKDCKPLLYYSDTIQRILENADILVGYNIYSFDLPFIFHAGIPYKAKKNSIIVDVMLEFAEIYGEYNSYFGSYKWQKLTTCAEYYSYSENNWHNSLDDAKATLYCFHKMFGNPPEVSLCSAGVYRSFDNIKQEVQEPVEVVNPPKSGRFMIVFGFFALFGFFIIFNPVCLISATLCLFFGFKRHKIYKTFMRNKGKH